VRALEDWGRVCGAMDVLGISPQEEDSFWLLLAAITNLGFLATHLGQNINGYRVKILLYLRMSKGKIKPETINILYSLQ
jgi:hypothetical protein